MANFTTGVIDLSIQNTFDNVIMGSGDTMTFSNTGTGGATGEPIIINGDFTMTTGATITLRSDADYARGIVAVAGGLYNTDLSSTRNNPGSGGMYGASGPNQGGTAGRGGYGGGSTVAAGDGENGVDFAALTGGAGGVYHGNDGSNGIAGIYLQNPGSGGGGGAAGQCGYSAEKIAFYVKGDISITGGTLNGVGDNGGDGGDGGDGGVNGGTLNGYGGGGGGGGGAGTGGNGGKLVLFYTGSLSESLDTLNVGGGSNGTFGTGGAGGKAGSDGSDGGVAGTSVVGDLIGTFVDILPTITIGTVSNIFSTVASVAGTATQNQIAITERGVVWDTSSGPTIDDNKVTSGSGDGSFTGSLTGLPANTTIYARTYATNSDITKYSSETTFKTIRSFIPRTIKTS